jgi:SAM-dependent methyltransferase
MKSRFDLEQIRAYWTHQSAEHGLSPAASWSDVSAIDLEIRTILNYLQDGDRVLDIGCANGYSTLQWAAARNMTIRALDYVAGMIDQAQRHLAAVRDRIPSSIEFDVGDILNLAEPDNTYDKVVVVRVVINLGNPENQRKALSECARVLRPGGMFLLSEATVEGWRRLNQLRSEWQLPEIPMPPFNLYLREDEVVDALSDTMELVNVVNFSSSYFVGTRIIKPLLIQALGVALDAADPQMEWNRWCASLPAAGDYGTQKLFVLKKR